MGLSEEKVKEMLLEIAEQIQAEDKRFEQFVVEL